MKKKKRTPRWLKSLLKNPVIDSLIIMLAAFYIRLVWYSGRWRQIIHPDTNKLLNESKPIILSFWHGRLLMMPYIWPHHHIMNVLISEHRDGILISKISSRFKLKTIAGSSSRGALSAVRKIIKALKSGQSITFTPDGPRGPYQKAAPGVISVAATTGIPIIPATFSAAPSRQMKSWDRFLLPYPFCRGVIMAGAPFYVDKEAFSEDALCIEIETRMNELQKQADSLVGC